MSIQFMENFESFGTGIAPVTEELLKGLPWADVRPSSTEAAITLDPITGERYMFKTDNNGSSQTQPQTLRLAIPTPGDHIGVAFRCITSALPHEVGGGGAVVFKDSSNLRMISLSISTTGQLQLHDYNGIGGLTALGNLIGSTPANTITANTLRHVEMMYDTTTGAYEVRVEGVPLLSGTHTWVPATNIEGIEWRQEMDVTKSGTPQFYVTDIVVWDDAGTQNNSFVGSVIVSTIRVDGDTFSHWSPSTGTTDYETLDEATPSDADYTESGLTENLILQSQTFDNASWIKSNATITANDIADPEGNTTADKIVSDGTSGTLKRVYQSITKAASAIEYTFSIFAKADEWGFIHFQIDDGASTNTSKGYFDLDTGAASTPSVTGNFTGPSSSIEDFGGGWYRCITTVTSNTATTLRVNLFASPDSVSTSTGDSVSGLHVWGAQLEAKAAASRYIPTTTTSVIGPVGYSQMTLENVPNDVVTIRALQTMVRALKTDGGDANMVVSLLSNGAEDLGSTHAVPVTAAYHFDISELDPNTAAAWTPVAVDAAEIKIDRTT